MAIELPPPVTDALARTIEGLRSALQGPYRWVAATGIHLTLKFLGDVASEDIAEVCRAVAESVRDIEPFEFRCHGAGAFPDLARPRTVWIGVDEGSEAVLALHQAVELALGESNQNTTGGYLDEQGPSALSGGHAEDREHQHHTPTA